MATTKEQIVEFIEAYAVAKTTGNSFLVNLSASALNQALDRFLPPETKPEPDSPEDDFTIAEPALPSNNRARTKRAE